MANRIEDSFLKGVSAYERSFNNKLINVDISSVGEKENKSNKAADSIQKKGFSLMGDGNKEYDGAKIMNEVVVEDRGLKPGTSGTLTEDSFDTASGNGLTVKQSVESRNSEFTKKSMLNLRIATQRQTKALTTTLTEIQKRNEILNSKFMKSSLQMSQNLISELQKSNNFKLTVQANYYKSSLDYKKNILTEIQKTNELLKIGFNIIDKKVDETRVQESFARMLFGGEYKKGLKQGLIKTIQHATRNNDLFNGDTAGLLKAFATGKLEEIRSTGIFKYAAKKGIGAVGKAALGQRRFGVVDELLNAPDEFGEKFANALKSSKNPLLQALGVGFGAKDERLATFDPLSLYETKNKSFKDRASFDKMAHTSLTNVIPTTLSKILAVLSKKEATYYNYATGKYETEKKAASRLSRRNTFDRFDNDFGKLSNELYRAIESYSDGSGKNIAKGIYDAITNDATRKEVFGALSTLIKVMASRGRSINDMLMTTITPDQIEVYLPKVNIGTRALVAQFLEGLKDYPAKEIQEAFISILELSDSIKDDWEKEMQSKMAAISDGASTATQELLSKLSRDRDGNLVKKDDTQWHNTSSLSKLGGLTSRRGKSRDEINMNALMMSSDSIIQEELKALQAKGTTLSDLELREVGLFHYKRKVDPFILGVAEERVRSLKARLAELEATGDGDTLVAKSIRKIIEIYENNEKVGEARYKLEDKEKSEDYLKRFDRYMKDGMTGANPFNDAKLKSLDARDVKEFTNAFLTSERGELISKGAQFAAVTGSLTLLGRKAGMGKYSSIILGGLGAGMLQANGTLNRMVQIMGTDAGDIEMEDGRTKREALMANLIQNLLPAGFATATGVKVSRFVKDNVRFGGILGPVMGYAVGSSIFTLSKMGFIKKLVKGLFTPIKWVLGGIDKKLFGGAVSSIFGGIGSAVKEMIPAKYKQKASLKDITSGVDDKDDVKDTLKRQKEDKLINQIEKMSKEEVESKFKNTDNLSDRVKAAINEKLGSGNASLGTISGTTVGLCAPAVAARAVAYFNNLKSFSPREYEFLAIQYMTSGQTGIKLEFFKEIFSSLGYTVREFKGNITSAAWESSRKLGKNSLLIGHMKQSNGHFVLFFDTTGEKVRMYDPLSNKEDTINLSTAMGICSTIIEVIKSDVSYNLPILNTGSKPKIYGDRSGSMSFSGSRENSVNFGGAGRKGSFGSDPTVQKVQIMGGHLDAVGAIGAVDAESYRNKMQRMRVLPQFNKEGKALQEGRDFFTKDIEARNQLRGQDAQEERERANAEALSKIAEGNTSKKEPEKKEGFLSKLSKWLPLVGGGLGALAGVLMGLLKGGPKKMIADVIEGTWNTGKNLLKKGKQAYDGLKSILNIGKKGAEEAAEIGIKEAGEDATEKLVKEGLEEGGEQLAKRGGTLLTKLMNGLSKRAGKLAKLISKLPVVGKFAKNISGSKIIKWFANILPKIATKVAKESAEATGSTLLKKGAKALYGGLKGAISWTGIGNAVSLGFAAWDITSAIQNIPNTFKISKDQVTHKHWAAAGLVSGTLSLIEAIVPFSAWLIIPIRISGAEGYLSRLFYKEFLGGTDMDTDTGDETEIKASDEEYTFDENGNPVSKKKSEEKELTDSEKKAKEDAKKKKEEFFKETGMLANAINGNMYGGFFDNKGESVNIAAPGTSTTPVPHNEPTTDGGVDISNLTARVAGGRGSGLVNTSSTRSFGNTVQFVSQNTFMKNHNMGSETVKDAGCALAVGKMISKFLGYKYDDMYLYNGAKKFKLGDNSVAIGFFREILGGQITMAPQDVFNALTAKGGAAVLMIKKGEGLHYVAVVNHNSKILWGDPENNDWSQIDLNSPLLKRFEQAVVFGNVISTNISPITRAGGKGPGEKKGFFQKAKEFLTGGNKPVNSSGDKRIGFGDTSKKGNGEVAGKNVNGNANKGAPSGYSSYGGSNYEYNPMATPTNYTSPTTSSSSGPIGPLKGGMDAMFRTIALGETGNENYTDPKVLGRVHDDSGPKTYPRMPYDAYGIQGLNTADGNSWWDFVNKGYLNELGLPTSKDKSFYIHNKAFRKTWSDAAHKDPNKMLDVQARFFFKDYLKLDTSNITKHIAKETGMSEKIAGDWGIQVYVMDMMTQYGPTGGIRRAKAAAGAKTPQEAMELMRAKDDFREKKGTMNRVNKRRDAFLKYTGKSGGAPIGAIPVASRVIIHASNMARISNNKFNTNSACGPATAASIHQYNYTGMDVSNDTYGKKFVNLAIKHRNKSGYVTVEYFKKFGGKVTMYKAGSTTYRSVFLENSLMDTGGTAAILNGNHWIAGFYAQDKAWIMDPNHISSTLKGNGKLFEITNHKVFASSTKIPHDIVFVRFNAGDMKSIEDLDKTTKTGNTEATKSSTSTGSSTTSTATESTTEVDTSDSSVRLKGGAIGGFVDKDGNVIDITGGIAKWLAKKGAVPNTAAVNATMSAAGTHPQADKWMAIARGEIGVTEKGNMARVMQYLASVGFSKFAYWCAAFVHWCMQQAGVTGVTGSASSLAPVDTYPNQYTKLNAPVYGAIGVWRAKKRSGGHTGFFVQDEGGDRVRVLGGNQGDAVKESTYTKSSDSYFTFVGWYLPKGVTGSTDAVDLQGKGAAHQTQGENPDKGSAVWNDNLKKQLGLGSNAVFGGASRAASSVYSPPPEKLIANSKFTTDIRASKPANTVAPISSTGNEEMTSVLNDMNKNLMKIVNLQTEGNKTAKEAVDATKETAEATKNLAKKDYNTNVINTFNSSKDPNKVTNDFKNLQQKLDEWKKDQQVLQPKAHKSK